MSDNNEILRAIGKLEGKVEEFHNQFIQHDKEDKELMRAITKQGERIGKVERANSRMWGMAAGAGAAVAAAWEAIRHLKG